MEEQREGREDDRNMVKGKMNNEEGGDKVKSKNKEGKKTKEFQGEERKRNKFLTVSI